MSDSSEKNKDIYSRDAGKLALSYNSVSTPDALPVFAQKIQQLPRPESRWIADIGCGPGRDAVWLADRGFNVLAIDSSAEMLAQTKGLGGGRPNLVCLQDSAPEMAALKASGRKLDAALMSAFLFHLDKAERKIFYANLRQALKPGAYVYLTLRHGPVPEGRRMFAVSHDELEDFSSRQHARLINYGRTPDPLGRKDVSWDHLAMRF